MPLDVVPYADINEAYDYFDTRPNSHDWTCSDSTKQLQALKYATRLINRLRFKYNKFDPLQANEFPRNQTKNIADLGLVPDDIKIATCEIAINLLSGVDIEQEIDNLFVSNNTYANISTGNNTSIVPAHIRAGIPSAVAWSYLRPYLIDPRKIKLRRAN